MAYEAYIAAVNDIAEKTYQAWSTGQDHGSIMEKLCNESNVETYHVGHKLTQLINAGHLSACLVRTDN